MMKKLRENKDIAKHRILALIFTVLCMLAAMFLSPRQHFVSALLLMVSAVFLYFYMVNKTAGKNYLDFSAVFTVAWLLTIGLSELKLLDYQKNWEIRTWINMLLAVVVVQLGLPLGHALGDKIHSRFARNKNAQIGRIKWNFQPSRLFWLCLGATVAATALFLWNVQIKGYVPFFSSQFNAYTAFYTKRMVFVTAACAVSPLAYWCIKRGNLSCWKKIAMFLCIAINTFLFPILQVNRGVFIVAALMLTASVVYLNKGKFWILVLCLVVTFSFYEVGSLARNYSNEYLLGIFEPTHITLPNLGNGDNSTDDPSTDPSEDTPVDTSNGTPGDSSGDTAPSQNENLGFRLPAKIAFLYGYFTVSHDNFNEAVLNATEYSYGIRQLTPFNVILRSTALEQAINAQEIYFIKPNLNTVNILGSAYYDLREVGVIGFMLIWMLILGAIEKFYLLSRGPFSLAAVGNSLTPIILAFFAGWFENFTFWMFWGTILLLMLASCITLLPKEKKDI